MFWRLCCVLCGFILRSFASKYPFTCENVSWIFFLIRLSYLQNHYGGIVNHRRIKQESSFGLWLTDNLRILWTGLGRI